MREDIKPTVELPLEEAFSDLTGFEVLALEANFGCKAEEFGGVRTLLGAVWAYENRIHKTDWATVKAMSLRELKGYFPDKDPDQMDSPQANLSTSDSERPNA